MRYDGLIIPRTYNDYFPRSKPQEIIEVLERYGIVDAALDSNSVNPVQNKVIAQLVPADTTTLANQNDVENINDDIDEIAGKIPTQASADNQLADKEFVNSSISTNTAHYIYKTNAAGDHLPFDSVEELEAYTGTVTPNDYAIVTGTDDDGNIFYDRYKADVDDGVVTWGKEYRLNNSTFTAEQWAAIQSGITAELVALIGQASGSSPIGTIANYIGSTAPAGWLLMNNERQLKIEDYPKLYERVKDIPAFQSENEGYFTLPDLSECVLVGAGENGTFDITAHDIYDIGQFKDDQFQGHRVGINNSGGHDETDYYYARSSQTSVNKDGGNAYGTIISDGVNGTPRTGTTTHGKQFGINYIIKATSTDDAIDGIIDDSTTDVGHGWSGAKIAEEISNKIADSNTLSELEPVTIGTSEQTALLCPYDGIIYIRYAYNANTPSKYYINNIEVIMFEGNYNTAQAGVTLVVKKGDKVHCVITNSTSVAYARWYKNRNYDRPDTVYVDNANNYSTVERVIGKWIDGKPLYQKTFVGTFNANQILLSNVNYLIDWKGSYRYDSNRNMSIQYNDTGGVFRAELNLTTHNLSVYCNNNTTANVTIEYTKTTD